MMIRAELEARAREVGYEPDEDDTDVDLICIVRERRLLAA
jgi:hypothetical protein